MKQAPSRNPQVVACKIFDFDAALFDACGAEEREDLLTEARILAHAFTDGGGAQDLEAMARTLSLGGRDSDMGRAHARKLAAALKQLARDA